MMEGYDNFLKQRELMKRRQCELGDGTWVSVQANGFVYCIPRIGNAESYTAVEAWFYRKDRRFTTGRRTLTEEPLAYLAATDLMKMIESHGGLVSGELPPLDLGGEEEGYMCFCGKFNTDDDMCNHSPDDEEEWREENGQTETDRD